MFLMKINGDVTTMAEEEEEEKPTSSQFRT
jgi:hypothetical protein